MLLDVFMVYCLACEGCEDRIGKIIAGIEEIRCAVSKQSDTIAHHPVSGQRAFQAISPGDDFIVAGCGASYDIRIITVIRPIADLNRTRTLPNP